MKKFLKQIIVRYRVWRAERQTQKIIAKVKRQYPGCETAMAMAWPATSGSTTGYTATGVTTIQWGTDGLLKTPHPSTGFYVVTRFSEKTLAEVIKLPNGTGPTSTRVIIKDGVQWNFTVRDDSAMTPPLVNGTVSIVDAAGLLGTVGLAYTATIVDNDYDTAPKKEGERVITAENLVLIESQTGA